MNETNKLNAVAPLSLPIEFWRALINVRNVAFAIRQEEYFSERGSPSIDSFRHSIDVVDNHLDRLIQDGWFNDDNDAK